MSLSSALYPFILLRQRTPRPHLTLDFFDYDRDRLNPSGVYSPLTHVTAGGIAGAVAAAVTTPLDVCKTLLQTRGTSDDAQIRKARGMGDAFRIIWERQGLRGFARGLTPRILTNMPSNALCCELTLSFPISLSRALFIPSSSSVGAASEF